MFIPYYWNKQDNSDKETIDEINSTVLLFAHEMSGKKTCGQANHQKNNEFHFFLLMPSNMGAGFVLAVRDAPPDPEHDHGADGCCEERSEKTIDLNTECGCQRSADKCAGDADEQVCEQAMIAGCDFFSDITRDDPDKQHAEKTDAWHTKQSMWFHQFIPLP